MSDSNHSRTPDRNKRNFKVGRVLEEYELPELDERLEELWLGDGSAETYSLRELSEHINKLLLEIAMERAGIDPLDGEIEETYRLLKSDDIDRDVQQKAIHRLEREGVDVDRLNQDFVTHQAVHTYLTEFRDVHQQPAQSSPTHLKRELKNELSNIAAESLEPIPDEDELALGNFTLDVNIQVHCKDCGETYQLQELIENRSCRCEISTQS